MNEYVLELHGKIGNVCNGLFNYLSLFIYKSSYLSKFLKMEYMRKVYYDVKLSDQLLSSFDSLTDSIFKKYLHSFLQGSTVAAKNMSKALHTNGRQINYTCYMSSFLCILSSYDTKTFQCLGEETT